MIYSIRSITRCLHFHSKKRRNWNFWHQLYSCRRLSSSLELHSSIFCWECARSREFLHQRSNWWYLLPQMRIIFHVYFLRETLKNMLFLCCLSYRSHDLPSLLNNRKCTVKNILVGCDNLMFSNSQAYFIFNLNYLHCYLFAFIECLWYYNKSCWLFLRDSLFGYSSWFSDLYWNTE